MKSYLNPKFEVRLKSLTYRFRFLGLYLIFGLLSLLLEFIIRIYLIHLEFNQILSTLIAIFCGILFAFWANFEFNFKVPRNGRNRAFMYFMLISCCSISVQWFLNRMVVSALFSYESGRLFISGFVFILAFTMHRKYSFRDFKKVGVAIYANGVEDLEQIHSMIGHHPDFIHVDIIDKSMIKNPEDVKTYRLETMKAYWPNIQIQTHIMSYEPLQWLDRVIPYSDVVYVHAECLNNMETLIQKINEGGKEAGIALTMATKIESVVGLLEKVGHVLLLTIQKPGSSGQKFDTVGFEKIEQINNLPFRNQFVLCIDGGVNECIVGSLEAEYIVSGSSVLQSPDPKRQIMRLQTVGRHEAT